MNIDDLESKLNNIKKQLKNNNFEEIVEGISNKTHSLKYELYYQKENKKYKELISQFSKEYLEMSDFYHGEELPRKTYLDSKEDVIELMQLFIVAAIFEPYINAYHDKYCKNN